MKITRERKIYAAVLGLVALGFALDRTIYGGSTSSASDSAAPEAGLVQSSPPTTTNAVTAEEPSLAARLASSEIDALNHSANDSMAQFHLSPRVGVLPPTPMRRWE